MHSTSLTRRVVFIVLVTLALCVPLFMLSGLVDERAAYQAEAASDIAASWGGAQSIVGPLLAIPETYQALEQRGDHTYTVPKTRTRLYTPSELSVAGSVDHELRRRGIHEVPVYAADLAVSAKFDTDNRQAPADVKPHTEQARLVLAIADTTGIQNISLLQDGDLGFSGGTGLNSLPSGIQTAQTHLSELRTVEIAMKLQGTTSLALAPVGAESSFKLTSSWPHPSFAGRYLPLTHEINADGFDAIWQVSELARDMPSHWIDRVDAQTLYSIATASISLFQPLSGYTLVDRATKYALLFISLTFLAYFCFELQTSVALHLVQYGVVGIALVMFYLTLLSLVEHVAFGFAYGLATVVMVGLIAWYTWLVTRAKVGLKLVAAIGALLLALYGCLYTLLMMEDSALLVGSTVLLCGLAALMYATRDLSQYAHQSGDAIPAQATR